MSFLRLKLHNSYFYIVLAATMFFFLIRHIPNVEYDIDPSYILFAPSRPPLYPLFIWSFHWAGAWQFLLIMWTQGLFTFCALLYARFWLRTNLQIADSLIFLVIAVVLITISFHFQIWFIQSEGLAFPLFIFCFFLLLDCFYKYNVKKLLSLAGLVSLLILTRLQFIYFFCLFILMLVWYVWQRLPIRSIFIATIIFISSIGSTILTDHTYHYVKHGVFGKTSYEGLMMLVQALYLTDSHAAEYFKNPTEKAYVQAMINRRDTEELNKDADLIKELKPSYLQYAYQTYSRNYLALQDIIDEVLNASVENPLKALNPNANAIALAIDKVLIQHALYQNSIFLAWKFVNCMGGVPQCIFFIILLVTLFYKIIKERLRIANYSLIFIAMVTIITFMNAVMIALCNPDLPVYFCYSQFLLYCLAIFLVSKVVIFTQASYSKETLCQKSF